MREVRRLAVLTVLFVLAPALASAQIPAFPSAEGFGASSVGGRGGQVLEVTNLNDSGPGSLRAALEANGPRIVVFRVGGTIVLQSSLQIRNPYVTVAGQTAPGGGITLRNDPANGSAALRVRTHDVVLRYLRMRPGPSSSSSDTLDALMIADGNVDVYNVIVDHCSMSWATDENVSTGYAARDVTIQWSISSEALDCSTHSEGCHSMGMLISATGSRNLSVHHNLLAHNAERNPRIKTTGTVDVVNNVIYNAEGGHSWGPSHVSDEAGAPQVNYVGNTLKAGADGTSIPYLVSGSGGISLYVNGNLTPLRSDDSGDQADGVVRSSEHDKIVGAPHATPPIGASPASAAFDEVLTSAGASVGLDCAGSVVPRRDSVDLRVVDDVRNGTGTIIDDPSEVGGWPSLAAGTGCPDADHDGMPDAWESANGLNPADASDGSADADGDGYTNVEEFLNLVDGAAVEEPLTPPARPELLSP